MNSELRLISRDGTEYVANLIYRGDMYGANKREFNNESRTLVEISRPRLGGDHFVMAVPVEELIEHDRWLQNDIGALGITAKQSDRARRWMASPASVEDSAVILVGDDDEIMKARVALSSIQLEPRQVTNGIAAIDQIRRFPPQLVVVGSNVGQCAPLDVVRRLRAAAECRTVPIIVIGGDPDEARLAGAALHCPLPPDYGALVKDASELLELM
jgi:hypothetical protein